MTITTKNNSGQSHITAHIHGINSQNDIVFQLAFYLLRRYYTPIKSARSGRKIQWRKLWHL